MSALKSINIQTLKLISWITVEPLELIYCLMFSVSGVVRDNLFMEKACLLDLNYSEDFCYNLTHKVEVNSSMKDAVQTRVTELTVYDGILVSLPSLVFCLFMGPWSDYHGRKLVMLLPFVGNLLSFTAYIVNYYFFYELSSLHLLWGSVVGLTGGYICLNIGLYGYVSDITSPEDRTMRLSFLNGMFSGGFAAGSALGGVIYQKYENYYVNFGFSIGFGLLGIIMALMIKESVKPRVDENKPPPKFFTLDTFKQSFKTAFKSRPSAGRLHIIILVINFAVFMFCLNSSHFDYLFAAKMYNWGPVDFSFFVSIQRSCRLLGLFLLLPFLSKILKLGDAAIASVGTLLTMFGYTMVVFTPADWLGPNGTWSMGWVMYLSAALQFNSIITVTIRSQCTKVVEKSEIGAVFSMVALGQSLVPLVSNPLFGGIYKLTVSTLPGAYMLSIVGMMGFVFASSIYMAWFQRRLQKKKAEL